jgi:hypothetical protein
MALPDAKMAPTPETTALNVHRPTINPAELAREIQRLQDHLTGLANRPTLDLVAATTKPLPDTTRGITLRPTG